MREINVFVSSPADVEHERQRAERVVERLNGQYAGLVRLIPIRCEPHHRAAFRSMTILAASGGRPRSAAKQETGMIKLQNLAFAALALIGASVPLAAYTGHYAPSCAWGTVWRLSGYHYQYICF